MTNVFVDFREFVVATLTDLQADSAATQLALVEINAKLNQIGETMADNSQLLNEVADGLNALGPIVADLLAENASLRGEDVGESAAAERVRTAFDDLASKFDTPDVPVDVEPLPEPGDGDNPVDEPA